MVLWSVCFFFSSRRRHTRCGRDWSSDVCSSDLGIGTLSHMAFASIGGYTSGLLTQWLRVPIPFGMLAGVIVCCAVGGAIGWVCLRMSGPYLAIFTLGFSEIVRITIASEDDVTAGMAGLRTQPPLASGP